MARMPRLVVPGYPHHVTQRGVRRMQTFFGEGDYRAYLELVAAEKAEAGVVVWAYCLMPNHVHLVVVPEEERSLARFFRQVHRRYTCHINSREDWRGHLWQERFHSFVMDEAHLRAAVRYVELNPVRAGLCSDPGDWPWSSARAHLQDCDDEVVAVEPMLKRVADWSSYLSAGDRILEADDIRRSTRTGRPAGDAGFIRRLEAMTGRELAKQKPGPKPGDK